MSAPCFQPSSCIIKNLSLNKYQLFRNRVWVGAHTTGVCCTGTHLHHLCPSVCGGWKSITPEHQASVKSKLPKLPFPKFLQIADHPKRDNGKLFALCTNYPGKDQTQTLRSTAEWNNQYTTKAYSIVYVCVCDPN